MEHTHGYAKVAAVSSDHSKLSVLSISHSGVPHTLEAGDDESRSTAVMYGKSDSPAPRDLVSRHYQTNVAQPKPKLNLPFLLCNSSAKTEISMLGYNVRIGKNCELDAEYKVEAVADLKG